MSAPTPSATAFAPASASNVGPGFDILGFAVDGLGDRVTATRRDQPGVEIAEITGDGGRLPTDAAENTAGVAALELLQRAGVTKRGVQLHVAKGMSLGSGLGSSAASAVAAVVAVDAVLELRSDRATLLACALEGERLASGAIHADNVSPCLYGGFVLVRSNLPPDIVPLLVPPGLACAVVRPHVEVSTRIARQALPREITVERAVRQAANLGALVAALGSGDLELLRRALEDRIAEPRRTHLVPGFGAMKNAALAFGAIGCTLSGSGPSTLALAPSLEDAERIADAMVASLGDVGSDRLVSSVGARGARVVDDLSPD
ncbi:MAG: homoserine kinase [Thermoanaerobaculia bacterium]|nr:homoserine kinase [Thermoanaerobaculia bacterium]